MENGTQIMQTVRLSLWTRIRNIPNWMKWLSISLSVLLIVVGLIASLSNGKTVPVNTVDIKRQDLKRFVITNGRLQAVSEYSFFAPVESNIMELKVRVGERVKKGQVLGRLDTLELERRYQNSLAVMCSREADLAGAEAGKQKQPAQLARADYEQALEHKKRLEILYESGAATKEGLEKAELEASKLESAWLEAKAREMNGANARQIESYRAQLELARKEAEQAKQRLEMSSFTAPFDGVVTKVEVKQGNRVTEGSLIMAIANDSVLEINASVNEIDAGEIKVGQTVEVSSLAMQGKKYKGVVEQVGGAAVTVKNDTAESSIKVPVLIKLLNPGKDLKVGYTVDLSIKTREFHNALAVPLQSVMERDGKKSVLLVKNGVLREQIITSCKGNELFDIALSGLKAGDQVVQNPSPLLKAGQKVTPQNGGGNKG